MSPLKNITFHLHLGFIIMSFLKESLTDIQSKLISFLLVTTYVIILFDSSQCHYFFLNSTLLAKAEAIHLHLLQHYILNN